MNDKTKPQDDLSIEEILGSIRRIISEDEPAEDAAPVAPAPVAAAPQPAVQQEEEPLELVNKIDADGTITNTAPVVEEEPITIGMVEQKEPAPDFDEKIILMEEPVAMVDQMNDVVANSDALLSSSTAESTAAVMAKLARHTALLEGNNQTIGGVTIEGLVREMLKPLLRDWLDSNLPDMVQKMVEREIQRLTKNL